MNSFYFIILEQMRFVLWTVLYFEWYFTYLLSLYISDVPESNITIFGAILGSALIVCLLFKD